MASYKVPGVSIAVIKDFKIDWIKHYGLRDVELSEPVTDSTLFCVGSLSKAVAAATILHLVDQGQIGLDDNVNHHLKSWKVPENEFTKVEKVTLRTEEEMKPFLQEPLSEGWKSVDQLPRIGIFEKL